MENFTTSDSVVLVLECGNNGLKHSSVVIDKIIEIEHEVLYQEYMVENI